MSTHCKHCGVEITHNGILWVDAGLVFPQYCRSKTPSSKLHEPNEGEFSLLAYVKQYQNNDLCAKWNNNIPLAELNNSDFMVHTHELEIRDTMEYFKIDPSPITGIVCSISGGDFREVYVTESARPYSLQAIYHPLSYYVEK